MGAVGGWLKRQGATLFDNPSSRKEFRVQLRGSRTLVQWSVFLLLLTLVGYFTYTSTVFREGQTMSLQMAQFQLHEFYQMTLALLGAMIALIAPALGASAVVTERQRRFLDLLIASPMSGRTYLIGKLMSSYRNIWMLMILALPVVAIGAVMGGATWSDVLRSFLVLSLDGLIFSSIALAISAGAEKLPSALLLSYLATIGIVILGSMLSIPSMTAGFIRHGGGAPQMSVAGMISPFTIFGSLDTVTEIGGVDIPNWLLFIPLTAFLVNVCLLGGVSALSTTTVRATIWFRILGLGMAAWLGFSAMGLNGLSRSGTYSPQEFLYPFLFLSVGIPFISCFTADGQIKFTYDGGFKIKNTFRAVPSGALFYLSVLLISALVGAAIALFGQGNEKRLPAVAAYAFWLAGVYAVTWAVSRITSQFAGTLASARGLATIFVAMTLSILGIVTGLLSGMVADPVLSPMSVLIATHPRRALVWGVLFLLLAFALTFVKIPKFFASLPADG